MEKAKIQIDLKQIEDIIFGEKVKYLNYSNLNSWKNGAKMEIKKLIGLLNGEIECEDVYKQLERIDYYLINDIVNFLDGIEFVSNGELFEIDNKLVDVCVAETIYNFYIQHIFDDNKEKRDNLINDVEHKIERIEEFLQQAKKQNIIIKIFNNKRELLDYLFIDGKDSEQILDSVERLIQYGFDIDKQDNIFKLDKDKYVYILV